MAVSLIRDLLTCQHCGVLFACYYIYIATGPGGGAGRRKVKIGCQHSRPKSQKTGPSSPEYKAELAEDKSFFFFFFFKEQSLVNQGSVLHLIPKGPHA